MKSVSLPIEIDRIKEIIPHRPPFLLVDRVTEIDGVDKMTAVKQISISDPVFQGHFPHSPIYPGVLVVEGLAQTAAVLGTLFHVGETSSKDTLLAEINSVRFRRRVIPGDVLTYKVTLERKRQGFMWFYTEAFVEGEMVTAAKLSAYM